MPALAVAEVCDVSPWDVWSVANSAEDVRMVPLRCPRGWAQREVRRGVLSVSVEDRPVLRTNVRGRLRDLRLETASLAPELPPPASVPRERPGLELPGVAVQEMTTARLRGVADGELEVRAGTDGACIHVPDLPIGRISPTHDWRG